MEITFVTTNEDKWLSAQNDLSGYPITLSRAELDTPEIQSTEVEQIAGYSAKHAAAQLGKPIMVTDVGYYITALNGFPGPFQKYINHWLRTDDIINMMQPYSDRRAILKECLAFCKPSEEPICFTSELNAEIAQEAAGTGSIMDQILIFEGFERSQGTYPIETMIEYWGNNLDHYRQFGEYIQKLIVETTRKP